MEVNLQLNLLLLRPLLPLAQLPVPATHPHPYLLMKGHVTQLGRGKHNELYTEQMNTSEFQSSMLLLKNSATPPNTITHTHKLYHFLCFVLRRVGCWSPSPHTHTHTMRDDCLTCLKAFRLFAFLLFSSSHNSINIFQVFLC